MLIEIVLCTLVGVVVLYWLMWTSSYRQTIPLDGKVIVITGCDTGFGNALARKLDYLGCTVFAGCLNTADEGAEALRKDSSSRLRTVALDVTKDDSVENAKKEVQQYLSNSKSQLWAVVNNAGIAIVCHIEYCSMKTFYKVAEVNLFGTIRVAKAFLPLIRQGKGRVVNVSSVHGRYSSITYASYDLSKHGVESFSDVLRLEMRKFGVKVSIIEPGKFGYATGISKGKAVEERLRALDESWEETDDEVKSVQEYRRCFELLRGRLTSKNLPPKTGVSVEPVIKAFVDALSNPYPRERYLVRGREQFLDSNYFLAVVYSYLPSSLMDPLTMYITGI